MTLVAQALINQLAVMAVFSRMGRVVVVEGHAKACEVCLVIAGNALDQCLGRNTFLFGTQHDGGAVRVIGAYVIALLATAFLEAHPDVGLDIFEQMAQVNGAVGIGKRTGDQNTAWGGR